VATSDGPVDSTPAVAGGEAAGVAAASLITEALGFTYAAALRAVALVGVADHFDGQARTPAEVAAATGCDAGVLHRVLRLLATRGVFREDAQGRFEMTELAEALRTEAPWSARGAVIMSTMHTHWHAAFELVTTLREGGPAFDRVFAMPFFDYLARHDAAGAEFHGGMDSFSGVTRNLALAAYEFPDAGVVVDVGGGRGGFLRDILAKHPGLRGVLHDREHVLAEHCLGELGTDERWELVAGDFFEAVPAGGDLYVLTYILHDWSDAQCVGILENCRRAMNPDGRVLAFDGVVPAGNDPDHNKMLDVAMAFMLTGRERTETEFRALFAQADLRVTRIVPTPGPLSVVEAVAG
jgi:O-methyltransferase